MECDCVRLGVPENNVFAQVSTCNKYSTENVFIFPVGNVSSTTPFAYKNLTAAWKWGYSLVCESLQSKLVKKYSTL